MCLFFAFVEWVFCSLDSVVLSATYKNMVAVCCLLGNSVGVLPLVTPGNYK